MSLLDEGLGCAASVGRGGLLEQQVVLLGASVLELSLDVDESRVHGHLFH